MGLEDRDYVRARRLDYSAASRPAPVEPPFNPYDSYGFTAICPVCREKSLVYSEEKKLYFCHNSACGAFGKSSADIMARYG